MRQIKSCERCGKHFERPARLSSVQWASRRHCSKQCSALRRLLDDDTILSFYRSGQSSTEISAAAGVSAKQVASVIRAHGATRSSSAAHLLSHSRPSTKAKLSAANKGRACPEHVKEALRRLTGSRSAAWVCGLTISAGGYLQFTSSPGNGEHAGRCLHQVIAEHKIGRSLQVGENVHHVDENKLNNHPDNLEVMMAEEHARLHAATNYFWQKRAS